MLEGQILGNIPKRVKQIFYRNNAQNACDKRDSAKTDEAVKRVEIGIYHQIKLFGVGKRHTKVGVVDDDKGVYKKNIVYPIYQIHKNADQRKHFQHF